MKDFNQKKLDKAQIERHIESAVSSLMPDVLDKIDLKTPQEPIQASSKIQMINRRLKVLAGAMAACLCLLVLSGGGFYVFQNGKVDSVIEIDVNPSIELTVNRNNKVLEAKPLNQDAVVIIDDMELKGVSLDIAVNAVIGSMVKHGYLDDVSNAILVTVSNDSIKKADSLRQMVVGDIQTSLKENQVEAVVYDQQAVQVDEIQILADQYGISYGKAYFLEELISQNPKLTMEDMEKLAPMTMEQIAEEITDGHSALAEKDKEEAATLATAAATAAETTQEETTIVETTTVPESTTQQTPPVATAPVPEPTTVPPATTGEVVAEKNTIEIDNVDYDGGVVFITFSTKVKWKNPTVSVKDQYGETFSAMIGETDSDYCEILVSGLEEGMAYDFVIGGIKRGNAGKATTVRGSFETPVISNEATEVPTENPGESTEENPDQELETEQESTSADSTSAEVPIATFRIRFNETPEASLYKASGVL